MPWISTGLDKAILAILIGTKSGWRYVLKLLSNISEEFSGS
jgi:hypothetical protein